MKPLLITVIIFDLALLCLASWYWSRSQLSASG